MGTRGTLHHLRAPPPFLRAGSEAASMADDELFDTDDADEDGQNLLLED